MKDCTNNQVEVLISGLWRAARLWRLDAWVQRELIGGLAADIGPQLVAIAWPQPEPASDIDGSKVFPTLGGTDRWGRRVFEQFGRPSAGRGSKPSLCLCCSAPGIGITGCSRF